MKIDIKIPSVGESVQEAVLAQWYKKDGDAVKKDEPLFVIETDKVTLEIVAEAEGILKITVSEGETVAIGAVVGTIDTAAAPAKPPPIPTDKEPVPEPTAEPVVLATEKPAPEPVAVATEADPTPQIVPPSVRRLVAEKGLDVRAITGTGPGNRITKADVLLHLEAVPAAVSDEPAAASGVPEAAVQRPETPPVSPAPDMAAVTRKPMSPMRQRIAARLLAAKQNTAMLTTFNEIDMSRAMAIRSSYKEAFQKKHGISLGFMSFFVKACVEALGEVPEINAFIDGQDILYHDHCHIGIAVGAPKGLVVPVLRHAEQMSFADVEQAIMDYVNKIKENRLELADLEGGTFTISNGGVFGSLLSTPILNMPQSGILGMHKIEKRPVVVDDEIVIRPMMYVALSYDHRIVDGKGAVTFLRRVKEFLENPERILLEV